jgi:integral membrane protein (TIGR01906 family)
VGPGAHGRIGVPGGRLAAWLIGAATALVLLGASIVPFTTPSFVHLEQARAGVERLSGFDADTLGSVTDHMLGDLFLWRGDFDVAVDGSPVLDTREQAHMREVRGVFTGFEALVLASIVLLVVAFRRARDAESRAATWRAVRGGARGLGIALVVAGALVLFAFDAAFEVFHRLFFGAGSYTFDPQTERLVQLFPVQFWSDTALAVGAVALGAAILIAWQAGRRAGVTRPARMFTTSKVGT